MIPDTGQHARRRWHRLGTDRANLLAVGVALSCLLLQGAGLVDAWRFDRTSIGQGEWWLLLSGNFVHLGAGHLVMNLLGLALVVVLVWPRFKAWQWAVLIAGCSLGVGLGLWYGNPEVSWYVGFSGTLHGLLVAGTLADLAVWPRSAALLLVGIVVKLGWEQIGGALPGSESMAGGHVVVDSHLYGALTGALLGALLLLGARIGAARRRRRHAT